MRQTKWAGAAMRVGLALLLVVATAAGQTASRADRFAAFRAKAQRAFAGTDDAALTQLVRVDPPLAVRLLMFQLHAISAGRNTDTIPLIVRRAQTLEHTLVSALNAHGVRGLVDRVHGYDASAKRTLASARRWAVDAVKAKRRGSLRAAITAAQRAAEAYDELGRPYLAIDAKRQLADALQTAGRSRQARQVFEEMLEGAAGLGLPTLLAQLHGAAMLATEATGDVAATDSHAERAERALRGHAGSIHRARFDEARGTILARRGEYGEAAPKIRSAIKAFTRLRGAGSPEVAQARMHLGVASAHRGDFPVAIRMIERALPVFSRSGMRAARAAANLNLGSLYLVAGRRAEAIESLKRAATEMSEIGNRSGARLAWYNLATLHARDGAPGDALDSLRRARGLLESDNPDHVLRWLLLATRCNIGLDRTERAKVLLDRATEVVDDGIPPAVRVALESARCDFLRATGDHAASLAAIDRAESILGRFGARLQLAMVLGQRGATLLAADRPEEALDAFDRASALREAERRAVTRFGDTARVGHARSTRARLTLAAAEAAYHAGPQHGARALTILERHTGTAMRDLLAEASIDAKPVGDPAMIAERRRLVRVLANLPENRRGELAALEARLSSIEVSLRASDPRYDALIYPRGLESDAIRAQLEPGEVLIAPLMTGGAAYAFVVDAEAVRLIRLGDEKTLRRPLDMLVNALRSGSLGAEWKAAARRLSERLVRPLEEHFEDARFLTIVPYGAFCFVPYDLLETSDGRPLVARWPIRLAHSATVLGSLARLHRRQETHRDTERHTLLALGGPRLAGRPDLSALPGAVKEVRTIAATLAESDGASTPVITVRTEEAAREAALTLSDGAAGYRAIHLACHGRADSGNPARCGLWLAPDDESGSDGFLSVREILQLRLDTDVVVLSACDSAVGRVDELEGVQSLTRAFLHAGTRSVVVSNWRVDDTSTPAMMKAFYHAWLREGVSPMEALRRAKDELRETGAHPTLWAGFALWGLGR